MTAAEIAKLLNAEVEGDGSIEITGLASLETADEGDLAFTDSLEHATTRASCLLAPLNYEGSASSLIRVKNPKLAFALVAEKMHARPSGFIHPSATVSEKASIGADVAIASGVFIGDDVTIGDGCVLHANVVVERGCTISNNVILHAGVVIGADGFGYVRDAERHLKFPQIGTVVIEDNVEIGANTCVDRGALGETRIGEGTKIDNLVQIAHNVQIGKRVIIASQTGISGSCIIEDDVVIGGQVGIGDHVKILSGAIVGSQAGILPGKIVRPGVWWGTPIQPLDEYKRQNARVKGLERLNEKVKKLTDKLDKPV
jgi:UDP-3-O-[3-hydroxymyristoyl] glucosamine N-acyltransferase